MAVIVQYIVEREGVQKMTFVSKKEADAYDKMLDISDEMLALLGEGELGMEEEKLEEIALYLAKNAGQAAAILKGAKPKPKPAEKEEAPAAAEAEGPKVVEEMPRKGRRKAA